MSGHTFRADEEDYSFIGANFWAAASLGAEETGNRERLVGELDTLQKMGVDNLRVQAGIEGPDNQPWRIVPAMQVRVGEYFQDLLQGLDFLLSEMAKRNMRAIMCLSNFWQWYKLILFTLQVWRVRSVPRMERNGPHPLPSSTEGRGL